MEKADLSTIFSKMLDISPEAAVQMLFRLVPDPPLVELIQPNFANVEEGDHLFYKTPFGMNVHFYVTANLGDGKIEVYGRFCKGSDDPFVEQKSFSDQTPSASSLKLEKRILDLATLEEPDCLKRKLYESTNIPEEKQRLEEYKTQKTLYGFLNNNSEHFVTFIKTGTAQCEIVLELEKALMKHFDAQLALHGGMDALKAAMTDGNWAALVVVLKKWGVISTEGKTAITVVTESIIETTAVQTTKSVTESGTVEAAKTVVVQATECATKSGTVEAAKTVAVQATKCATKSGTAEAAKTVVVQATECATKSSTVEAAKTVAVQTATSATKSGTVQAAKTAVKAAVKGTVVVQVAFEGVIYTVSMSNALYQYVNGHMSKEEFKDYTVKQSATSVGSLTGGIGGSLTGIAAGAAIGSVVPVVGTTIGGAVGGFVGGVGGGIGGTAFGRLTGNWINWLRK